MTQPLFIGVDLGSKDENAMWLGRYQNGVLILEDFIRKGTAMKKVKQKKLTKDQQKIHDLTKQLTDLESSLRSANYRETDLTRKLAAKQKEADDNAMIASEQGYKVERLTAEIRTVADGLFEAKAKTTQAPAADVAQLHRHIGYAEGRLDAALSVVTGYITKRGHSGDRYAKPMTPSDFKNIDKGSNW